MANVPGISANASAADIENELVFERVLLESLDPHGYDYGNQMKERGDRIAILESALEEQNNSSLNSSFGTMYTVQDDLQVPRNEFASMLGPIASYNMFNAVGATEKSPPPTPPSFSALRSPQSFTLDTMSRKRPHAELSSPTMMDFQNAKRHTPSPANSMPHTPAAEHSPERQPSNPFLGAPRPTFGMRVGQDDLLRQHQQRAEMQVANRRQQLERDLMYANSLALGVPAQRAPSGQSSSQTVFNRDGTVRNPYASQNGNTNRSIKGEPNSGTRQMHMEPFSMPSQNDASSQNGAFSINKQLGGSSNVANIKRESGGPSNIKHEFAGTSASFNQPRDVPQIIDLDSDDDDESNSGIEEIDASEFQAAAARRYAGGTPMPPRQQPPQLNGSMYAQPSQNYQMPGAFPGAPQMGYRQPSPALYSSSPASMVRLMQQQNAMASQNGMNRPQMQQPYMMNDSRAMALRAAMGRSTPGAMNMPGGFPGAPPLLQNPYLSSHSHMASNGRPSHTRVPPFANIIDLEDSDSDDRRNPYGFLYNDPTRSADEIKKLIESIASGGDLPPEARLGTPAAMVFPLMEHQKIGLTWLKGREEGHSKGGILADDMGLGKTIQAIALIISRPSDDPLHKTTLIIAPVALLRQWALEIKEKLSPSKALSVHIHHGQRKKPFNQLRRFDVVLTTYGSLGSELKKKERWDQILANNPSAVPTKKEELSLIGPDCSWYRVILDEAQCIKNRSTGAAKAAFRLRATYRLCMTGTPMMNNVGELFSLIAFCRIKPYNAIDKFRQEIQNPLNKGSEEERRDAMRRLQGLVKATMLRRTKNSKLDGKPIITLKPRTTDIVNGEFDEDQESFYRALEDRSAAVFNRYLKAGTVLKNYSSILALLLRLRQVCDHPQLATDYGTEGATDAPSNIMLDLAGKLSDDVVRRIKDTGGEFTCPICIDAIPPPGPVIFFPCGHYLDNDCMSSMVSSALANGGESELKCPECRAKLSQTQVIDYPTFKKIHMPEECPQTNEEEEHEEEEGDDVDTDSDSSDDEDETSSLDGFIVEDGVNDDDEENAAEGSTEQGEGADEERKPKVATEKKEGKKKSKGKKKKKERKSFAKLRAESLHSKAARKKYMRRLEKTYEPSAKIQKTLELLLDITTNKPQEKILIFSQFTSFLDILEVPLMQGQYQYCRFDGSMSAQDRDDAVQSFRENASIKIMLISLKAGNAGLNLNCASQVIILDPFWNPYIEEQAIDRAHRIGQLNNVNVHRIVIPNTVEDRILELQEKKREMISTALDENAGKSLARLGERELGYLFGVFRNTAGDR